MKIALSAESTVDLPKQILEQFGVNIIPFNVLLGEQEFKDDGTLTNQDLFDFVKKTGVLPKTAAISTYDYEEHFTSLLTRFDAIIHFSLSEHLSSAYQNAVNAAKMNENIVVINSQSLSTGIALLVLSASEKIKQNKTLKQIETEILDEIPRIKASFVLDTLSYMHKGGRCSAVALLGANLLKIKPQIVLSGGKMTVGKKYRGKQEDVLVKYTEEILAENNPDKSKVFITYSSSPKALEAVVEKVKAFGFENVYITQAGATICSHCGPETLGVLFINKGW